MFWTCAMPTPRPQSSFGRPAAGQSAFRAAHPPARRERRWFGLRAAIIHSRSITMSLSRCRCAEANLFRPTMFWACAMPMSRPQSSFGRPAAGQSASSIPPRFRSELMKGRCVFYSLQACPDGKVFCPALHQIQTMPQSAKRPIHAIFHLNGRRRIQNAQ